MRARLVRLAAPLVALTALLATTGCGDDDSAQGGEGITVLAAASLTNAFQELGDRFEADTGVPVRFSFAGSQEVATQVRNGAPADVVATADEKTMASMGDHVGPARSFAHNHLTIVVAPGNPKRIRSLHDLERPDLTVVMAGPQVPAGRYARQVLDDAGVKVTSRSDETDVRGVLTRVRLGEADAGIVYETDARAYQGEVEAIPLPEESQATATYQAAVTRSAGRPADAERFVSYLQSPEARKVLKDHGFGSALS